MGIVGGRQPRSSARDIGCAENRGGGPNRTPLTTKVEIIDGDYDALAGAIRKAGRDPPDLLAAFAICFPPNDPIWSRR